jgi:steroid delta-isomerase-like uncharacterized protein
MSEQSKMLVRRFFEDTHEGNKGIVDELVAGDYVGHTPLGEMHGPDGVKQFDAMLHAAFPDMQITVEDQISGDDRVATRWTCRGTHKGEFQGMPPTGRQIKMTGMTIFRIANDKLVEGWVQPDLLGLMQQLGAIPEPGQS